MERNQGETFDPTFHLSSPKHYKRMARTNQSEQVEAIEISEPIIASTRSTSNGKPLAPKRRRKRRSTIQDDDGRDYLDQDRDTNATDVSESELNLAIA